MHTNGRLSLLHCRVAEEAQFQEGVKCFLGNGWPDLAPTFYLAFNAKYDIFVGGRPTLCKDKSEF